MAKTDVIRYTLRLNLNNPEHLAVHEALRNLNTDIYKSQNGFMVEAICRYIKGDGGSAAEQNKMDAEETKKEYEELEKRVTDRVMKEMMAFLFSVLVGRRQPMKMTAPFPAEAVPEREEEEKKEEYDETLADLVDQWS